MRRARQTQKISNQPLYPRTPRQREILLFISDYKCKRGYSPTYAEIATYLGVRNATVFEHLKNLEDSGYITKRPNKYRSIEICDRVVFHEGAGVCPTCGHELGGIVSTRKESRHVGIEQEDRRVH